MSQILIVFDRKHGKILRQAVYDTAPEAISARVSAEQAHKDSMNVEIVVLNSASIEEAQVTHSRYFKNYAELGERILNNPNLK